MLREIKKVHFTSLDSTQQEAKKNPSLILPNLLLCIYADEQTLGKGTNGRNWNSPKDANIYLTVAFSLPSHFKFLANLSQIMSLSIIKALRPLGFDIACKWPNDLMIFEKKLAGILTEVQTSPDISHVFCGVGINVNMQKEELVKINQTATSLYLESKHFWDKEDILNRVLYQFREDLHLLENSGFSAFKQRYMNHLLYKDKITFLKTAQGIFKGKVIFIDEDGLLHFETDEAKIIKISAQDRIFISQEDAAL